MTAERCEPGQSTQRPLLSAIVLGYRAGASLGDLVRRLREAISQCNVPYEIVLVGNYWPGEHDDTPRVVCDLAAGQGDVIAVAKAKRGGMGWDMRSGLDAARADILIVIDGDGQNPVEDVVRMYELMREGGLDMMKGRRNRRPDGIVRAVISTTYNAAFRVLFGTSGLWDINGKPKGVTRVAYEQMRLSSDDWFIDAEMVLAAKRLGLRIGEMSVDFLPSTRLSFVRLSAIFEFLANMTRHRLRRSSE